MSKNTQEESALFREMIGRVQPLKKGASVGANPVYPKQSAKKTAEYDSQSSVDWALSDYFTDEVDAEKFIEYMAPGESLSPEILRKIRKGEYPKEMTLDLHGDTIDAARIQFLALLKKAELNACQSLFIIHGKGKKALLKNHVIHWLKQIPFVLFFCSASAHEGGAGALYVLLKRKKKYFATESENIENCREKINALDDKITALLCERFDYAKKVAALKKTTRPDIKREQDVLERIKKRALDASIPSQNMEEIYKTILIQMKKYQQEKS